MPFAVPAVGGALGGWVAGSGPPVLLLHGGPGLGFEYLDPMAEEVLTGPYRVASFQQRGLTPSTVEGPFTLAQAVADVEAVLDHLGWSRVLLVGHSWGGHLALHVAVSLADRLAGVLAVDPLGGVGDGGAATFGAELLRRLAADRRPAAEALQALDDSEATPEQRVELLGILWPSYFASPDSAPPMPEVRIGRGGVGRAVGRARTRAAGTGGGAGRHHGARRVCSPGRRAPCLPGGGDGDGRADPRRLGPPRGGCRSLPLGGTARVRRRRRRPAGRRGRADLRGSAHA